MEAHSKWHDETVRRINSYKDTLSQKDQKKYKLDLLLRIIRRVDDFSAACGECHLSQSEITKLIEDLGYLLQMPNPDKEKRKSYFKTINNVTKHLQKSHKLVTEGYYLGIGTAIGVGIGAVIGAALGNSGAGTGIGVALGLAIGKYLDDKAKKEGRII